MLREPLTGILSIGFVALVAPAGPARSLTAVTGCPAPQPASGMTPTFASDFTRATALDATQWVAFSGPSLGDPAIEAQAYDRSQLRLVPNVGLRISTQPGALLGKPYRSGAVTTKDRFSQAYGHFEMMARMPQANGLWPAFWLLPASGRWPPEIDIIEYIYSPNGVVPAASAAAGNDRLGSNPATTLHWGTVSGHSQTAPWVNSAIPQQLTYQDWNRTPAPPGWSSAYRGYHTYAVDWRPTSLVWTVDGIPVFCVMDNGATGRRIPDTPMYMLINDAVSTGTKDKPNWPGYVEAGTSWPQTMDVAYVRVSRFDDGPFAASEVRAAEPSGNLARLQNGKIGPAEAKVMNKLSADSPDLCSSGTASDFIADASGWRWQCRGSYGGSDDPTGLAFRAR